MKLLVPSTLWPRSSHTFQAANIILYELLCALAATGEKVTLLKIDFDESQLPTVDDQEGISALSALGIRILEPMVVPSANALQIPFPVRSRFFPLAQSRDLAQRVSEAARCDAVLIPLSEAATTLFAEVDVPKFAYYGNPDPKVRRARRTLDEMYDRSPNAISRIRATLSDSLFERAHLREMSRFDFLGNIAANDADYYRANGHPNAFYVRNVWLDRYPRLSRLEADSSGVMKIVGNVGRLSSTANSFGLGLLADELVPALRSRMKAPFAIHIFGSGSAYPILMTRLSRHPDVIIRGFVEDIDTEIASAGLFVCLNNASTFKVCHTRYLHAWSLRRCVVAHRDAALSIPEMQHMENALLGSSVDEIADLISIAAEDRDLRESIGLAGYETFKSLFTARSVVPTIWNCLRALPSVA